jgi:hypothetical protein
VFSRDNGFNPGELALPSGKPFYDQEFVFPFGKMIFPNQIYGLSVATVVVALSTA